VGSNWILYYKDEIEKECNRGNPDIIVDVAIKRSEQAGHFIKPSTVIRRLAEIGLGQKQLGVPNEYRDMGFHDILKRKNKTQEEDTTPSRGIPVSDATKQEFKRIKPGKISSDAFLIKLLKLYEASQETYEPQKLG